jgi:hypothetical protein
MVFNHTIRHRFEHFFAKNNSSRRKSKSPNYQKLEEEDIDEQINIELSVSQEDFSRNQLDKSVTYYY